MSWACALLCSVASSGDLKEKLPSDVTLIEVTPSLITQHVHQFQAKHPFLSQNVWPVLWLQLGGTGVAAGEILMVTFPTSSPCMNSSLALTQWLLLLNVALSGFVCMWGRAREENISFVGAYYKTDNSTSVFMHLMVRHAGFMACRNISIAQVKLILY